MEIWKKGDPMCRSYDFPPTESQVIYTQNAGINKLIPKGHRIHTKYQHTQSAHISVYQQ